MSAFFADPVTTPRLSFFGATQTVTGSCFLLETSKAKILIDCGLFQGSKTEKELNYRPFPFDAATVGAVLLTHAHIDHSGLLPKLMGEGFTGPIFATAPTLDLCSIMLPDSGHIQEMEVQQLNTRNRRRGRHTVTPIYTAQDAVATMALFRPVPFKAWQRIADGVKARYWNAGHLLGSASIEVEVLDGADKPLRLLFSGDIGPGHKLLQADPEAPAGFDYIVCESTYGDAIRTDATPEKRLQLLREEVKQAARSNGTLLIPSFAVERTQELLVDLIGLMNTNEVPRAPIFIDSPLATMASGVFAKYARHSASGDALTSALQAHNVHFTESVEQSKAISRLRNFHVVIAASGMCEAGRIRHHLRDWLWREEATILLVGYQAQGTLGRLLLDGASRVRLMGEEVQVRARIRSIDLYSGHADAQELLSWMLARLPVTGNVFLTHGEREAIAAFKDRLAREKPELAVLVPAIDEIFALTGRAAERLDRPQPPRIEPETSGRLDWNNDLSKLLLDINDATARAADERARRVIIRRLRRALMDEDKVA
ncbi:MBL fold metallo-hydrolase RNA specificity domain-containing protein [Labrys neptuniae]